MAYFLLGGHDWNLNNQNIERALIKASGKKCPTLLLFPTAMKDKKTTIERHHLSFKGLNVIIKDALLCASNVNIDEIKIQMKRADILYFTGGSTRFLLSVLRKYKLDSFLYELAKDDNKIFAGSSAGAIMWCKEGMTDGLCYSDYNHTYGYSMLEALNHLPFAYCPHYQHEDLICFNDEVSRFKLAIASEDDTAVYIKNGIIIPLKGNKKNSIYVFRKDNGYKMTPIYQWKKLSILGPMGTFSSLAGEVFLDKMGIDLELDCHSSIRKAGMAIKETGIGVLPMENTLDGYVQETLDLVYENNYHIIADLNLKIEFAFVCNTKDIKDCKNVYVQYKAKGQCLEFLDNHSFNIIETDSNITSLNRFEESNEICGAIVPVHSVLKQYPLIIKNVEDSKNNYTRFIVVTKEDLKMAIPNQFKASLILSAANDHPGILYNLLAMFSIFDINLNAIMSRPTKQGLGSYYFYIEFSNNKENYESILEVIQLIQKKADFNVQLLGIYDNLTKEE